MKSLSQARERPVLRVRDLRTHFFSRRGVGKAVDGVSLDLHRGETLGLVGESGCGKSITALSLLRLNPQPASRIVGGEALFEERDLLKMPPGELRSCRGRRISMVLQDPMTALNPVFRIGDQIGETIRLHLGIRGVALHDRILSLLRLLHIPEAEERVNDFPHQFSGGMRQRVVGAIGMSCSPDVLIADEPTTSLDVTLQAAYLVLLKEIQREHNIAILFITHDFGIVANMCDYVGVMYAGRIIESAATAELFCRPTHPYTQGLLNSVPSVDTASDRLASIPGNPPSIFAIPPGCAFSPRCPRATTQCQEIPPEIELHTQHMVRCWYGTDIHAQRG